MRSRHNGLRTLAMPSLLAFAESLQFTSSQTSAADHHRHDQKRHLALADCCNRIIGSVFDIRCSRYTRQRRRRRLLPISRDDEDNRRELAVVARHIT